MTTNRNVTAQERQAPRAVSATARPNGARDTASTTSPIETSQKPGAYKGAKAGWLS